jgi:signal transduction histidine kinase
VKQTKRAADITRKLLMFSQGSGAPREWLQLDQILEDTIALVSYQTSLDGIEIAKAGSAGVPPFYGNVHELREIFLNLILNAVQSVGQGGKVQVEMHHQARDRMIELRVSDTGPGIPAENIGKVFDPFFTTRTEAVGLGLFVTRQIVGRYGGSIRAESRPGEGTMFLVRIPQAEAPSEQAGEPCSPAPLGVSPVN